MDIDLESCTEVHLHAVVPRPQERDALAAEVRRLHEEAALEAACSPDVDDVQAGDAPLAAQTQARLNFLQNLSSCACTRVGALGNTHAVHENCPSV